MSNLTLPDMSYANLDKLLTKKGRLNARLGYETTAHREVVGGRVGEITIRHHGSAIASLTPSTLVLTNAGYNTSTTTARLSKILHDATNSNHYGIAIRQRLTSLVGPDRKPIVTLSEVGGYIGMVRHTPGDPWILDDATEKRIAEARELVIV